MIVATRGEIFSLKFTKYRLAAGLRPHPLGELKRSPRPASCNKGGLLLRGGEGRGLGGEGKIKGRKGEGRGTEWKGRGMVGECSGKGGEGRGDISLKKPWLVSA